MTSAQMSNYNNTDTPGCHCMHGSLQTSAAKVMHTRAIEFRSSQLLIQANAQKFVLHLTLVMYMLYL